MSSRLVFFDLETGGLDPLRHPIIQVAAIAVDEALRPVEEFEAKIAFDISKADADALKKNCYSAEVWDRESKSELHVCDQFTRFLKRFADVRMVSQRTGNPYMVAQLIGHNAAIFDGPFLQHFYRAKNEFLPASYRVLCTLQRAMFHFHERPDVAPPDDFKLATLCLYFGINLPEAHDALQDVRATLALYQTLNAAGKESII